MLEQIIIYGLLAGAVLYLGIKFFFKRKKDQSKNCDHCN
jgi:uncharacterized membrane-anchored protein